MRQKESEVKAFCSVQSWAAWAEPVSQRGKTEQTIQFSLGLVLCDGLKPPGPASLDLAGRPLGAGSAGVLKIRANGLPQSAVSKGSLCESQNASQIVWPRE